jgi:vacuolar protein sorting-associated protein 72
MASEEASNPSSPASSSSSASSSRSHPAVPEALAHGREKRATAGNKLRALLDAEFQEEEIFKEDEDDQEFERQKSDEEEVYLSSSESSSDEEAGDDEEAGEKALIAEQKSIHKAKKRKADKTFVKPVAKRPAVIQKHAAVGILASKPTSTTSSVSNRRISFDPALLASRRSSRALTVQTTNETQERIISAAARRATLPVIPRREQTPPLTQEERLAQAVLTEEENKMSLMRIVEAEEERARKRREKLEALRRRRFDEPIVRFISRRGSLIEEIPSPEEEADVVIDDGNEEPIVNTEVITEGTDDVEVKDGSKEAKKSENGEDVEVVMNSEQGNVDAEKMEVDDQPKEDPLAKADIVETAMEQPDVNVSSPQSQRRNPDARSEKGSSKSVHSESESERMDVDEDNVSQKDVSNEKEPQETGSPRAANSSTTEHKVVEEDGEQTSKVVDDESTKTDDNPIPKVTDASTEITSQESTINPVVSSSTPASPPKPLPPPEPKTPPPYHEAYFTSNTVSILPLPGQPLQSTRDTFFPSIPLVPPPKPKPYARCPITGLLARYKDPLSGVGYYDIHAFKILREVGRKGSRYVWCSEGGWFVGELGWGGRGAKGVPEGWTV